MSRLLATNYNLNEYGEVTGSYLSEFGDVRSNSMLEFGQYILIKAVQDIIDSDSANCYSGIDLLGMSYAIDSSNRFSSQQLIGDSSSFDYSNSYSIKSELLSDLSNDDQINAQSTSYLLSLYYLSDSGEGNSLVSLLGEILGIDSAHSSALYSPEGVLYGIDQSNAFSSIILNGIISNTDYSFSFSDYLIVALYSMLDQAYSSVSAYIYGDSFGTDSSNSFLVSKSLIGVLTSSDIANYDSVSDLLGITQAIESANSYYGNIVNSLFSSDLSQTTDILSSKYMDNTDSSRTQDEEGPVSVLEQVSGSASDLASYIDIPTTDISNASSSTVVSLTSTDLVESFVSSISEKLYFGTDSGYSDTIEGLMIEEMDSVRSFSNELIETFGVDSAQSIMDVYSLISLISSTDESTSSIGNILNTIIDIDSSNSMTEYSILGLLYDIDEVISDSFHSLIGIIEDIDYANSWEDFLKIIKTTIIYDTDIGTSSEIYNLLGLIHILDTSYSESTSNLYGILSASDQSISQSTKELTSYLSSLDYGASSSLTLIYLLDSDTSNISELVSGKYMDKVDSSISSSYSLLIGVLSQSDHGISSISLSLANLISSTDYAISYEIWLKDIIIKAIQSQDFGTSHSSWSYIADIYGASSSLSKEYTYITSILSSSDYAITESVSSILNYFICADTGVSRDFNSFKYMTNSDLARLLSIIESIGFSYIDKSYSYETINYIDVISTDLINTYEKAINTLPVSDIANSYYIISFIDFASLDLGISNVIIFIDAPKVKLSSKIISTLRLKDLIEET